MPFGSPESIILQLRPCLVFGYLGYFEKRNAALPPTAGLTIADFDKSQAMAFEHMKWKPALN
jgi:hypothetical protein